MAALFEPEPAVCDFEANLIMPKIEPIITKVIIDHKIVLFFIYFIFYL